MPSLTPEGVPSSENDTHLSPKDAPFDVKPSLLSPKRASLDDKAAFLALKDELLNEKASPISSKATHISKKDPSFKPKDASFDDRPAFLSLKVALLNEKHPSPSYKDTLLNGKAASLSLGDTHLDEKDASISSNDAFLDEIVTSCEQMCALAIEEGVLSPLDDPSPGEGGAGNGLVPDAVGKDMHRIQRAIDWLFAPPTDAPHATLIIRLMTGGVFFSEGILKFVYPNQGVGRFTKLGFPLPDLTASFVGGLEIVGGLLLMAGLLTRFFGLLFIVEMIVAILTTKVALYFGTSPLPLPPSLPKVGAWAVLHEVRSEYAQLLTSAFLAAVGPGAWSLDAYWKRASRKRETEGPMPSSASAAQRA